MYKLRISKELDKRLKDGAALWRSDVSDIVRRAYRKYCNGKLKVAQIKKSKRTTNDKANSIVLSVRWTIIEMIDGEIRGRDFVPDVSQATMRQIIEAYLDEQMALSKANERKPFECKLVEGKDYLIEGE